MVESKKSKTVSKSKKNSKSSRVTKVSELKQVRVATPKALAKSVFGDYSYIYNAMEGADNEKITVAMKEQTANYSSFNQIPKPVRLKKWFIEIYSQNLNDGMNLGFDSVTFSAHAGRMNEERAKDFYLLGMGDQDAYNYQMEFIWTGLHDPIVNVSDFEKSMSKYLLKIFPNAKINFDYCSHYHDLQQMSLISEKKSHDYQGVKIADFKRGLDIHQLTFGGFNEAIEYSDASNNQHGYFQDFHQIPDKTGSWKFIVEFSPYEGDDPVYENYTGYDAFTLTGRKNVGWEDETKTGVSLTKGLVTHKTGAKISLDQKITIDGVLNTPIDRNDEYSYLKWEHLMTAYLERIFPDIKKTDVKFVYSK